jgi:hypothetical protein
MACCRLDAECAGERGGVATVVEAVVVAEAEAGVGVGNGGVGVDGLVRGAVYT